MPISSSFTLRIWTDFSYLSAICPEQCGEQEKRQDKKQGTKVDQLVGVHASHLRGLENKYGRQCVLDDVVVEGSKAHRHEERHEPSLLEQRKLGWAGH